MKKLVSLCLAVIMLLSLTGAAFADEAAWVAPHDITIRCPKAAGDTMNDITRLVSEAFHATSGTVVMITTISGANGAIAAADLKNTAPDPCEMMSAGIVLFTLAPLFSPDITMNLDDWKFVCGLTSEDFVLVANASSGLKSWDDVKAYAAGKTLKVGTQAPGGAVHMLAAAICGESGINWTAVTSDSSPKDILACSNGTVDLAIATTSGASQYIAEGSVIPLMTFGNERSDEYEDVPTAQELGYEGISWKSLNYIMTRSEVDDETIAAMYSVISSYCETEAFLSACQTANIVPYVCDGAKCYEMVSSAADMCNTMFAKYYAD